MVLLVVQARLGFRVSGSGFECWGLPRRAAVCAAVFDLPVTFFASVGRFRFPPVLLCCDPILLSFTPILLSLLLFSSLV